MGSKSQLPYSAVSRIGRTSGSVRRYRFVEILGKALPYPVLLLLSVSFLRPFLWMISTSLKNDPQIYTVPPV